MQLHPMSTWFRPKRFGFGWTPATWEGWVVTAAVAALAVSLFGR